MKFKNHEDYLNIRNQLLAEAESAMQDNDESVYEEKVKAVNDLDEEWDLFAKRQADLRAMRGAVKAPGVKEGVVSVMEDNDADYRKKFMNYVLRGTPIMKNENETTTTSDIGAVIPTTIMNRIVELMEKNGNILAKVTQTAYKGGVRIPVSIAKPKASWVAERGDVKSHKKTAENEASVVFSYYKLKVKVAVSIIVDNMTLEIFEKTIAANIAEAIVRELENSIINGTGVGQPKGLLEEDIPEDRMIEATDTVTYKDIVAAEAALPAAYEGGAEWIMHKKVFFNHVIGMTDSNGQPIARVDHGIGGRPEYSILGRTVNVTEHMPAAGGDSAVKIGILFDLKNYMINKNMEMTIRHYTDEDNDDEVTKAIMIADGKAIDTNGLVFLTLKNA